MFNYLFDCLPDLPNVYNVLAQIGNHVSMRHILGMQHIEKLPVELCAKAEPLVALSGLDIDKNELHRSIWCAFNTNRGCDREPLKFVCLPIDHQFPKAKTKVSRYHSACVTCVWSSCVSIHALMRPDGARCC